MKTYGVVGTLYCGSTILSYVLGSHSKVFASGELHVLKQLKWENKNFVTQCTIHKEKCNFWTQEFINYCVANYNRRYDIVREKAHKKFNTPIMISSDKDFRIYQQVMKHNEFNGFIIMFKRPEAFCYSYMTHENKTAKDINSILQSYYHRYCHILTVTKSFPTAIVFYDDFATDTRGIIRKLCVWLNIDYEETMLNFWDFVHHSLSGNSGATLHLKKETEVNMTINSQYWKKFYSQAHAEDIKNNHRKIKLDTKWKTQLTEEAKSKIQRYKYSQQMFLNLMEKKI